MLPPQPAFILAPAIKGKPLRGDWAQGLSRSSLKVSQRPPAGAWVVPGSNSRRKGPQGPLQVLPGPLALLRHVEELCGDEERLDTV